VDPERSEKTKKGGVGEKAPMREKKGKTFRLGLKKETAPFDTKTGQRRKKEKRTAKYNQKGPGGSTSFLGVKQKLMGEP